MTKFSRIIEIDDLRIALDPRSQRLYLDLPEDVYSGFTDVLGDVDQDCADELVDVDAFSIVEPAHESDADIVPTLADLRGAVHASRYFVSASQLALKAKLFDDGLLAAVDLAAQAGVGSHQGRAHFLRSLLGRLNDLDPGNENSVAGVLFGAAQLGGLEVDPPTHLRDTVAASVAGFLQQDLRSKPIGFYTWSADLSRIFRQDRLLQEPLQGHGDLEHLVRALCADPELAGAYRAELCLHDGLTNPRALEIHDLEGPLDALANGRLDLDQPQYHLFPPSLSHETQLLKSLFSMQSVPDGFDLMNELVKRIHAGSISLEPHSGSGWYDYQTWSLEPLLNPESRPESRPESQRLRYSDSYRAQLTELFKGILALTRETHIKQLEIPSAIGMLDPAPKIVLRPALSVEPLPEHYLRRAIAYRFVHGVVARHFGESALADLHRLTPQGPLDIALRQDLLHMSGLFFGAYLTSLDELGMSREDFHESEKIATRLAALPGDPGMLGSLEGEARDREIFAELVHGDDPDLASDPRMMVPVFFDVERNKTKVWAMLGWSARPLQVSFAEQPHYVITDHQDQDVSARVNIDWESTRYSLPYPVMVECYVSKILDREEFRILCDAHQSRAEIVKHLQAL